MKTTSRSQALPRAKSFLLRFYLGYDRLERLHRPLRRRAGWRSHSLWGKKLEVRRWIPDTPLPLRDLLIVQNQQRLGSNGLKEDPDGIVVDLVK